MYSLKQTFESDSIPLVPKFVCSLLLHEILVFRTTWSFLQL